VLYEKRRNSIISRRLYSIEREIKFKLASISCGLGVGLGQLLLVWSNKRDAPWHWRRLFLCPLLHNHWHESQDDPYYSSWRPYLRFSCVYLLTLVPVFMLLLTTRYANNQIMLNCIPSSALSNYPCDQLLTSYNIVLECVHRQDRRRPSPPGSFCPGNICIKVEAWISVPYFQRVLLIHHRCTSIVVSCKMSA
jgi:hypothetical protein